MSISAREEETESKSCSATAGSEITNSIVLCWVTRLLRNFLLATSHGRGVCRSRRIWGEAMLPVLLIFLCVHFRKECSYSHLIFYYNCMGGPIRLECVCIDHFYAIPLPFETFLYLILPYNDFYKIFATCFRKLITSCCGSTSATTSARAPNFLDGCWMTKSSLTRRLIKQSHLL